MGHPTYTDSKTIDDLEYKTVITTPSGTQVREYEDDGTTKSGTFDAREAIDTTTIAKAFLTGTAPGYNSFESPLNAMTGKSYPDGGTIVEYKGDYAVGPGEMIRVGETTHDRISFVPGPGTDKDTITDSSASGGVSFEDILKAEDKIFCTGSAQSGNNNKIFEVLSVTATVITLTQTGVTTATSLEEGVKIFKIPDELAEYHIAGTTSSLELGIRNAAATLTGVLTKQQEGPVIWFKNDGAVDFNLTVSDGLNGTSLVAIKDEIAQLSTLPSIAPHNFFMKILGNADEALDDYYVKFKAEDELLSNGTWEETRLYDLLYKFNPATMPHALIKEADGDFRFAQLDGSTLTVGPPTYPAVPVWSERLVGDGDTNPNPTFIGQKINDIFIFKNRLGLLSDENVILSETSEFFNFFRTTSLNLLETSPLDVASTHSKVSILTSAVPFARQLTLFSDSTQFVLGSGNAALGPETVSITTTTSYDSVLDLKPISLGSSIYFGFSRGNFSGLRQYLRSNDR